MACSIVTVVSYEDPARSTTTHSRADKIQQRRRHSSYHARHWPDRRDDVHILVDDFLTELGHRLDFLETYGHLKLDNTIERAYSTLHTVRESCSQVSDEVIGAGWRRANILVDTLENQYKGALATKETLEQKVQEGVRLMESSLAEFETRAYVMKNSRLAAAGELIEEGWRRVDSGIEKAKEVVDEGLEKARQTKEALKLSIDAAIKGAREHGLIKYEDLPDPWKVNPHITRGYRFSDTKLGCLRSILRISNELFNIWSHIIGLVLVLSIAFYIYPRSPNFSISTKSDIFIAACFFLAACKCLVCSTMWHTMSSISSQDLLERFACVDYTGISLLVATSIMTVEYCAFYCEPVSRWTYMLLTASLGIGGTVLPWHPTFNQSDMAWARVGFYVLLAATGFLPFFQLSMTYGLTYTMYFYAPIAQSILVYLGGAILYAAKIPERWFPGMFDYVGGSHNIWHLAVLGGILFHYMAMQEFFSHAFLRAQTHCSVH